MKIEMHVVTYKNDIVLNNWFLKSLQASKYPKDFKLNIIDNNASCQIYKEYQNLPYKLFVNNLRPSFSTGHLSRNWNLSIINGFKNLNKPDCDLIITVQNDTILHPDWFETLLYYIKKYDYITQGIGDQFQVFTPNCIKNIGLYDERFCNIGYQEADYFLRAAKFYSERSSINDKAHGRIHNPIGEYVLIQETESGIQRLDINHLSSTAHHCVSSTFFKHKWNMEPDGNLTDLNKWKNSIQFARQQCFNYILYPYFEKNLNGSTFLAQKYIVPNFYTLLDED